MSVELAKEVDRLEDSYAVLCEIRERWIKGLTNEDAKKEVKEFVKEKASFVLHWLFLIGGGFQDE